MSDVIDGLQARPLPGLQVRVMRFRTLLPLVLLWAGLLLRMGSVAGQTPQPYSLEEVLALVEGEVAPSRILHLVGRGCLGFELDLQAAQRLRAVGATSELIGDLATVCRASDVATRSAARERTAPQRAPPAPRADRYAPPSTAGRFGHLAIAAMAAPDNLHVIPIGAELAVGLGYPAFGVRGSIGFVGVVEDSEPGSGRSQEKVLRALGYAAADAVLAPGWDIYALAGGSILSNGELVPRIGVGLHLPTEDPDGLVVELRAQPSHSRFWGTEGPWTEGVVISVSFGLGGRIFR